MDTTALDRQLGDLMYIVTTALRSGYSLRQILETQAARAPEPTASALKGWAADLDAGLTYDQAFANLQRAWPSPFLARIIGTIRQHQQTGGNLADMLDPIGPLVHQAVGTDQALYSEMRDLAHSVGASLPEGLQES